MNACRRSAVALLWILFVLAVGCNGLTTPDEDDRLKIVDAIIDAREKEGSVLGSPSNPLEAYLMNSIAKRWLSGKSKNQRIGRIQCQFYDFDKNEDGPLKDAGPELTVEAVVACLNSLPNASYWDCANGWANHMRDKIVVELRTKMANGGPITNHEINGVDCEMTWDAGYGWKELPPSVKDYAAIGPDDIGEAFISAPVPPPGWVLPASTWEVILPMICLSGTPWGCPTDPAYPNPNEPAPSMGPGDYWSGDAP